MQFRKDGVLAPHQLSLYRPVVRSVADLGRSEQLRTDRSDATPVNSEHWTLKSANLQLIYLNPFACATDGHGARTTPELNA
jgi:hypothetical protein